MKVNFEQSSIQVDASAYESTVHFIQFTYLECFFFIMKVQEVLEMIKKNKKHYITSLIQNYERLLIKFCQYVGSVKLVYAR